MTKDQKQTEELVERYIDLLDTQLENIKRLKGANSRFIGIQNAYVDSICSCIDKARERINDVKNGAVWDNLVIAFFGETNAGKSTIIETFRILFGEQERVSELKDHPDGVDGLIVGTGESDYTQVYKEYKMEISGMPFTLIDVPGIEGNEIKYYSEIKDALNKAHFVFFVQGQNKKLDTGTAGKIRKYLRDWVKVYSIYNVRGVASKYEDEKERAFLLSESERKVESQIKETFREVLGSTYIDNITLQAYIAMCSKAKFAPFRTDLLRGQNKLKALFGSGDLMYQFCQFDKLINIVKDKAKNFQSEILEANKEKHKALLYDMYSNINYVSKEQEGKVKELGELIDSFKNDISRDFGITKRRIKSISNKKYDSIYSRISGDVCYAIDNYDIDLEHYCKKKAENIVQEENKSLQQAIKKEFKSLNSTIKKRKKKLDQELGQVIVLNECTVFSEVPDFCSALDKLDFNTSDFSHCLISLGGLVTSFFLGPIGLLTGTLSIIQMLFGGRNKKAEAKEKLRENLNESKEKNRSKYMDQISKIEKALNDSKMRIADAIDNDNRNLKKLRSSIQEITNDLTNEYSIIKNAEYGKL